MRRRDAEVLTDLVSLEPPVLAPHERARGLLGQSFQAHFQRDKELLLLERAVGVVPGRRKSRPVTVRIEQLLERLVRLDRGLAAALADRVDDLVLEDAGQPGA